MTLIEAILCGILQGLAEFLPISSSGHLALLHALFGMEGAESYLAFDILLHLGTLIVVFVVFYREIFSLVPAFFTMLGKVARGKFAMKNFKESERYVIFLILASVPLVLAYFLEDAVASLMLYTKGVGIALILNGILLLVSDRLAKRAERKKELTPLGAVLVGIFQLVAIVPGLSRSGSTISGGLLAGLDRTSAVRFSFILSIPAILAANLISIPDALTTAIPTKELASYLVGMAFAVLFGFIAIKLLLYISRKSRFGYFSYYCVTVGVFAVIFG